VSWALGQAIPLTSLVVDGAGDPANAGAATLTITLPDGTTDSPTVANPPTTVGTYVVNYLPDVAGLHGVRWVFTGSNASAPPPDSFYVDSIALIPLVSLAEAREQCRTYSTDDDALLQRYIRVASAQCERRTQIWRRQTFTVAKNGGGAFIRLQRPVISITSVTESGVAVASTGWTLDSDLGLLYRGDSGSYQRWECGRANVAVEYVAGASDGVIPDEIRQGILQLVEHLWNTQRGGSNLPRNNGGADYSLPAGFTVPNAVLEQWRPWIPELVA